MEQNMAQENFHEAFSSFNSSISILARELESELSSEWIHEAVQLCMLLSKPHVRAILVASDAIARKDYLALDLEEKYCSDSIDEFEEELNPIKIVQFVKNREALGSTVYIDEITGHVVIARVMFGGAAWRSGLVTVGDAILEVNGIQLYELSPYNAIKVLEKECTSYCISLKLLAGDYISDRQERSFVTVRAHFSYNPFLDSLHPCPEAGLVFKNGDILDIVKQSLDKSWWEGRHHSLGGRAGLLPGRQLQERRVAANRDFKTDTGKKWWSKSLFNSRKTKKSMYRVEESEDFNRDEIFIYTEVDLLYPEHDFRRPVVIVGPKNVGRDELINHLIEYDPDVYVRPIAHTSRLPQQWEDFVSKKCLREELESGKLVESGECDGHIHGTHIDGMSIMHQGKVCLLSPDPKSLKQLHTGFFKPFIIFVKPPYDLDVLQTTQNKAKQKQLAEMILEAQHLEYFYSQYFDWTLTNANLEETKKKLISMMVKLEKEPFWVPTSWTTTNNNHLV